MVELAEVLSRIPNLELDLTGCAQIASHGLPTPVVVTLERRPDRWADAQRRLSERGVDRIIKATAVDGRSLTSAALEALLADPRAVENTPSHYLQMTRPAVGCFLSHIAIWKRFLQSGAPHVLILEDDARLAKSYTPELGHALMASIPGDADMLLFGCTVMDGLAEPTGNPTFSRVYYYNGTYGYLLTRLGCLKLLPRLLPIETHIDNQISLELVRDRECLRVYATTPRVIEHDFEVYSDIYIPVADAPMADRKLDRIFKASRAALLEKGARLFDMHQQAQ